MCIFNLFKKMKRTKIIVENIIKPSVIKVGNNTVAVEIINKGRNAKMNVGETLTLDGRDDASGFYRIKFEAVEGTVLSDDIIVRDYCDGYQCQWEQCIVIRTILV